MTLKNYSLLAVLLLAIQPCIAQFNNLYPNDRGARDEFGGEVAISNEFILVGARLDDKDASGNGELTNAGSAYIFQKDANGNFIQAQKIVASNRGMQSEFGSSLDISNDYLVVGAPKHGGQDDGIVFVFERDVSTNQWIEQEVINNPSPTGFTLFGHSVAINGDILAIGSPQEQGPSSARGAVYIYNRDSGGVWQQTQHIVPNITLAFNFGLSLDLRADELIIGGLEDGGGVGRAYVYELDGSNQFQLSGTLSPPDPEIGDNYGFDVAINDNGYAVVGARLEDEDQNNSNTLNGAGSAYIFSNSSGSWSFMQKVVALDRTTSDNFGSSVSINNNNVIAIGALFNERDENNENFLANAGAVYIYENDSDNWFQSRKIVPNNRNSSDKFGNAVDLDDTYMTVGAFHRRLDQNNSNAMVEAGSAYVFNNENILNLNENGFDEIFVSNPVSNDLEIRTSEQNTLEIEIFDLFGRLVLHRELMTKSKIKLNVSHLSSGIYIAILKSEDKFKKIKLIKE